MGHDTISGGAIADGFGEVIAGRSGSIAVGRGMVAVVPASGPRRSGRFVRVDVFRPKVRS